MTDISKINALAGLISSSSKNIRNYALAQAAISISQEKDIQQIWKEIELLKAHGSANVPPPEPVPPPVPTYGTLLPARLARSTGSVTNVSSLSALTSALGSVPNGSIINITADIVGSGRPDYVVSRSGSAAAPVTITCNPGVKIQSFRSFRLTGSYVRVSGLEITDNGEFSTTDGIKLDGTFLELEKMYLHDNIGSGVQVGSTASDIQIWDTVSTRNGQNKNLDHGIYFAKARGNCVIANCKVYDNWAYNLQLYSDCPNIIVTCTTVDGGLNHGDGLGWERGGIISGDSPQTFGQKLVGILSTNAPVGEGFHWDGTSTVTNNVYDSLGFGNAGGDFNPYFTYANCTHADPLYVNRSIKDFRLQAGSPAIGKIQAARYGYVPQYDILGRVRITADAGCFAA